MSVVKKETHNGNLKASLITGISALISNLVSGVFYPLEILKLKLQVNESGKTTTKMMIKSIYLNDGLKGFFRGFYFNICIGSFAQLLFFINMDLAKYYLNNHNTKNYSVKKEAFITYFSGLSISLLTLPIWTLKTRITLTKMTPENGTIKKLNYTFKLIYESYKVEGFFGLYKGILSTSVLATYGMIQMTLYNTLKYKIEAKEQKFEGFYPSLIGVFSRITASIILYPFNLVRTRQQQFNPFKKEIIDKKINENIYYSNNNYGSFSSCLKMIYKNEGILGFYKGMSVLLIRQVPYSATFFYVYENTKKMLTLIT